MNHHIGKLGCSNDIGRGIPKEFGRKEDSRYHSFSAAIGYSMHLYDSN